MAQQLGNTDGAFIRLESPTTPQHIAMLIIYDPSTSPKQPVRFRDILATFQSRLPRSPLLRRKLKHLPLDFDHPFWVDDSNFDIEFHVRHVALPKPGDWRQLCIQVSRLHARHLDFNRPLWEAYVIEGLNNVEGVPEGAFALYLKIHHCAVDGMGAGGVMLALHDLEADPSPDADSPAELPNHAPTSLSLLSGALSNTFKRNSSALGFGPALFKERRLKAAFEKEWGVLDETPKPNTRFDRVLSPHRVFDAATFSLIDFKLIRKAVPGASVNDVSLTIVGQAMRRYLLKHNELPETSLRTIVPVSLRKQDDAEAGGNAVSNLQVPLHSDTDDALEALRRIHASTERAKAYRLTVAEDKIQRVSEMLPPPLLSLGRRATTLGARLGNPLIPANTTVSNVPGPPISAYLTGSEIVKCYGLGMLVDGMGLFHVVNSYKDELTLSFTACREQMPDYSFYRECLVAAFNDVKSAAASA